MRRVRRLGRNGQVKVFQNGERGRRFQLLFELVVQKTALGQRIQNAFTSLVQFLQSQKPVPDGGDRHFVQAACGLLAVAGNKRNGSGFLQQPDDGLGLLRADVQFLGDLCCMIRHVTILELGKERMGGQRNA